jgi:hypothetical protein
VSAPVAELLPGAQYTFCLIAHNSAGETAISSPVTFTTLPAAPMIASESVSNVESTEATLNAQIDPDGAATTFRFEYLTAARFEADGNLFGADAEKTAETALPETDVATARITGLQPGTTYHYRVVATNSLSPGGTAGPDKIFTTPIVLGSEPSQNCKNEQRRTEQPYGLKLPDCRAYEMVSPLETNGQDATDSFVYSGGPRASVSGNAVTYASRGDFADPTGDTLENQFVSSRGSEGWSTREVTPLHEPLSAETFPSYEAAAFTPELTEGVASTNASLTEQAPTEENGEFGLYVDDFATGVYQYVGQDIASMGTSTDLSHVVFGESGGVSEWVNGSVVTVSVGNKGEALNASVGTAGYFGTRNKPTRAVSSDGLRVYLTSLGAEQMYVRENPEQPQSPMNGEECTDSNDACTVEVSASQKTNGSGGGGTDPHGPQPARYWDANAEGSKVFFTSTAELTNNAYTGPEDNAANLYEYELSKEPGKTGRLTQKTARMCISSLRVASPGVRWLGNLTCTYLTTAASRSSSQRLPRTIEQPGRPAWKPTRPRWRPVGHV